MSREAERPGWPGERPDDRDAGTRSLTSIPREPHAPPAPPGRSWLVRGGRPFVLVAVLALLVPLVVVAAQQDGLDTPSPASGHASVIAQGIVPFPAGEFVCRVVRRVAEPLDAAAYEEQVLGFVIATEGPLLLADEVGGGQKQVARLAVGELFLVRDGTSQRRASVDDRPTTYFALEIVPVADRNDVGEGTLLSVTDAIPAPAGDRDLDLVQDVLAFNDQTRVTDGGAGMVILATDGAVEVVPRGGRPRTLQPGELGVFPTGVDVTAVEAAEGGNAKRAILAPLGAALGQTAGPNGASFLACVIGPEVPPLTQGPPAPRQRIVPRSDPEPTVPAGDGGGDRVEPEPDDPEPTATATEPSIPTATREPAPETTEPTPTPRDPKPRATLTVFQTPVVVRLQEVEPTEEAEG